MQLALRSFSPTSARRMPEIMPSWRAEANPDWRAHYNLACFYSKVLAEAPSGEKDQAAADALADLRWGVEPAGAIRQWAMDDPSLEELREYSAAEFLAIVHGRPIPEGDETGTPNELGTLLVVGKAAGELTKLKIETFGDLVRHAATHGLRVEQH